MHDPGFSTVEAVYQCAYRSAFRLLKDSDSARDVAQEATARALARWERVQDHVLPWVSRVAVNLVLGDARKRHPVPVGTVPERPGPAPAAEAVDLIWALQALPRRQREVVALRYLGDWTQEDVALALGCSVGSVRQHTARGLARLRQQLGTKYLVQSEGEP